ncbi:MAG: histidine phosphatase family protein [Cyclobacteriaceae bacterium]|nr:histidine phosphatase family protein [Cyclobacteriaceae bacterium]
MKATLSIFICIFSLNSNYAVAQENEQKKIVTFSEAQNSKQKQELASSNSKSKNRNGEPVRIKTFEEIKSTKQKQETETAQQKIQTNSENQVSIIILLRHAEKSEDGTKDPSLSDKGKQRANTFALFFKDASIDAFYATPYKRAIETIAPLAKAKGKEVLTYNPTDRNSFAEMIQAGKGKKIVIAGHSNTVPLMVNALIGKNEFTNMDENDYGKIWFLVFKGDKLIDYSILNY